MKRFFLVAASIVAFASPVLAGNGAPSGSHYQINIIGVENPKGVSLTDTNRRTIFVDLVGRTDIFLTQGAFTVCDGNGFDAAKNCGGGTISRGPGAVFRLPCNTATPTVTNCSGVQANYSVWARALGTPGGNATITTCAYDATNTRVCSTENAVLSRNTGKPVFKDVTRELTTLYVDVDGDSTLDRVALFDNRYSDFLWQYDNQRLRVSQLRFYNN